MSVSSSEENILKLFGNEAAENEPIERLREYYVKNYIYDQVVCDTPLRILVGHKGIGKSALVKMAISEDADRGSVPLLIRPDDIVELASEDKSFLELIRDWKVGLIDLLSHKCLDSFGVETSKNSINFQKSTGKFINFIADTVTHFKDSINLHPARRILLEQFIKNRRIMVQLD